jgi:hypothetical protein
MGDYAEFRLLLAPDVVNKGNWSVAVDECPIPGLAGAKGSVTPSVTRADLAVLRSRNGWPNTNALRDIGDAVWRSVMSPQAEAAFLSSLQVVAGSPRGLRLVVVIQGQESEVPNPLMVRLSELPVEALFHTEHHFLATDLTTPISRSLQFRADRAPETVALPLRVLVAIASPLDKPTAKVEEEVEVIEKAVAGLRGPGGKLEVDFLPRVTREGLVAQLATKPYHVLHFIGHGGFDEVGDVEAPRAHLCFVRPDSDLSDPTDADTLAVLLRNTSVRLMVLTACASAAPTPAGPQAADPGPLGTGAFDGMAQRLVAGVSGLTSAVAMQFDLEDLAAVEFSKAFYTNLLRPGLPLDEVVTLARKALVAQLQAGHRAWVTPAVYWRCKNGNVFEIDASVGELDPQTLRGLQEIDFQLTVLRTNVEKISMEPTTAGPVVDALRLDWIAGMEKLLARRNELLGETVRARGGRIAAGQEISCTLSLRVRQPANVGLVQFRVEYPEDKLAYLRSESTAGAGSPVATAVLAGGALQVVVVDPGVGQPVPAGEKELGSLRFAVRPGVLPSVVDLRLSTVQMTADNKSTTIAGVDGLVFVER